MPRQSRHTRKSLLLACPPHAGLLIAGLILAIASCSAESYPDPDASDSESSSAERVVDLPPGTDTFLSAAVEPRMEPDDGIPEEESPLPASTFFDEATGPEAAAGGGILRNLDGSLVLRLHRWRGLQVVDASDPEAPEVIGRAQFSGAPVQMYVFGDEAWVLLNAWRGYANTSVLSEGFGTRSGAAVLRVDLRDPMQPRIRESAWLPGRITDSLVARSEDSGETTLSVAASRRRPILNDRTCEDYARDAMREEGLSEAEIDERIATLEDQGELHAHCTGFRPWDWEDVSTVRSWTVDEEGVREGVSPDQALPGASSALGALGPNATYTHFLPMGDLALRVQGPPWSGAALDGESELDTFGSGGTPQRLEIIESGIHPDAAVPVGALTVEAYDAFFALDGRIVATALRQPANRRTWRTHVDVYDLDDPSTLQRVGSLESGHLIGVQWGWGSRCLHCWSWFPPRTHAWLLGDQMLLPTSEGAYVSVGERPRVENCVQEMPSSTITPTCSREEEEVLRCERHFARRTCRRALPDGEPTCTEQGAHCVERHDLGAGTFEVDCREPDWDLLPPPSCRRGASPLSHREHTLRLSHVDLSDPAAPRAGEVVDVEGFDRSATFVQAGDTLYHSWAEDVEEEDRPMLRWYLQPWRVTDGEVERGEAINAPGIAMAVVDDLLLSEDRVWFEGRIHAALRLSRIESDRIVLIDSYLFPPERELRSLALDTDLGLVLATTQTADRRPYIPHSPFLGQPGHPTRNRIVSELLDVRLQTFTFDATRIVARAERQGDPFAELRMLSGPLALIHMTETWHDDGGILVMDLSDPYAPQATAYQSVLHWPGEIHEHEGMPVFPSSRYGLLILDPIERNLLDPQ